MIDDLLGRLEAEHGVAEWRPSGAPVETLVGCILSQHTTDWNAHRAMEALRVRYPDWETLADADADELAEVIRCGGLGAVKAARILAALRVIREREGGVDLTRLHAMDTDAADAYLAGLPGVGPKTASIVLSFALGRPALPVDTHVFRVSWRLGLVERRCGAEKAEAALERVVPEELRFRFHVALIRHGRKVCRAARPRCGSCVARRLCAFGEARTD